MGTRACSEAAQAGLSADGEEEDALSGKEPQLKGQDLESHSGQVSLLKSFRIHPTRL